MPLHINFLAERVALEEAKRNDPIKRAVQVGVALTVLMILWIISTGFSMRSARKTMESVEVQLAAIDAEAKSVKALQDQMLAVEGKIGALGRYASNRFLMGNLLNEFQFLAVDRLRLTDVETRFNYVAGVPERFFVTNVMVAFTPPPSAWQFWASAPAPVDVARMASNQLAEGGFFQGLPLSTNRFPHTLKVTIQSTNQIAKQYVTLADFVFKPYSIEQITVTVRGRDYGTPAGAGIDQFVARLSNSGFFRQWLTTNGPGYRIIERPPLTQMDPGDPIEPERPFLPFALELRLKERIFGE